MTTLEFAATTREMILSAKKGDDALARELLNSLIAVRLTEPSGKLESDEPGVADVLRFADKQASEINAAVSKYKELVITNVALTLTGGAPKHPTGDEFLQQAVYRPIQDAVGNYLGTLKA